MFNPTQTFTSTKTKNLDFPLETLTQWMHHHPLFQTILNPEYTKDFSRYGAPFYTKKTLVILGVGGSCLGGRAFYTCLKGRKKSIFVDQIDADVMDSLAQYPEETTGFIIISKSGETPETLAQAQYLGPKETMLVITETSQSSLGQWAKKHGKPVMPHVKNLGGRYAALSNVGLFPLYLAGWDVDRVFKGAQRVMAHVKDQGLESGPIQGAMVQKQKLDLGYKTHVMMAYGHPLKDLVPWFCQLWGESLGKKSLGTLPMPAYGPMDQHSLLQLFLDGPRDKIFTLLGKTNVGDHPLEHLLRASYEGTMETLATMAPVRCFDINPREPEDLGAFMMFFFIETLAMSLLLGVDPFDQPAVDQNKRRIAEKRRTR